MHILTIAHSCSSTLGPGMGTGKFCLGSLHLNLHHRHLPSSLLQLFFKQVHQNSDFVSSPCLLFTQQINIPSNKKYECKKMGISPCFAPFVQFYIFPLKTFLFCRLTKPLLKSISLSTTWIF